MRSTAVRPRSLPGQNRSQKGDRDGAVDIDAHQGCRSGILRYSQHSLTNFGLVDEGCQGCHDDDTGNDRNHGNTGNRQRSTRQL